MGLYLSIFDHDIELDGVEVGSYADFADFRSAVKELLQRDVLSAPCPTLLNHSDCDGSWSPDEAVALQAELIRISKIFVNTPPILIDSEWKLSIVNMLGLAPSNLYECFFDIDGEPLIERIIQLTQISIDENRPILFQ